MAVKKRRVQRHHTQYPAPEHRIRELILPLYQGEHFIVSQIQRLKPENCSTQFWDAVDILKALYRPYSHRIEE